MPIKIEDITYNSYSKYGPRTQTDWQLVYVYSGEAEVHIEGSSPYIIEPGQVSLLEPGLIETFYFAKNEPTSHGWCTIDDIKGINLDEESLRNRPKKITFSDEMKQLTEYAMTIRNDSFATETNLFNNLIQTIFLEFLRSCKVDYKSSTQLHPSIDRAIEYMMENYHSPLDLLTIATHSGISVSHMIQLFHDNLNSTPIKFLTNLRVREASRLLKESGLSIGEIADRCGFANPQHFSRVFREHKEITPKKYRMKQWS